MSDVTVTLTEAESEWLSRHLVMNALTDANRPGSEVFAKSIVAKLKTAQPADMGNVSDGYHTFNELYEHRHALFLLLMKRYYLGRVCPTWIDVDPNTPGWFLAGIDSIDGQIAYHLPERLLPVARQYAMADYRRTPYDGYTSADVLARLQWLTAPPQEAKHE